MDITYSSIKSYILEEEVDGSKVNCKFEVEGKVFESSSHIKRGQKKGSAKITSMVRNTALGRLRSRVLSVLRRAVGGGFAGTAISMAGNEAMRQGTDGLKYSSAEKESAVVAAFLEITHEITYENGKWRLAKEFSEFEKIIKRNPITMPYDKKILARMLVEMANADGKIEASEKMFFDDFLTEETGSLGELMRAPAVSLVECEEISSEAKESVFMLVAAVALTDNEFSEEEKIKLEDIGQMMDLSEKKYAELLTYAQDYTIESFVKTKGQMTRDELYAFADRIGMDRGEAERAQIKMEKRLTS